MCVYMNFIFLYIYIHSYLLVVRNYLLSYLSEYEKHRHINCNS